MAEPRRVRVPVVDLGSKGDILRALVKDAPESANVFDTMADALAFAACYGSHYERFSDETDIRFGAGNAIRFGVFESRGYDILFDVLAVARLGAVDVLADAQEQSDRRVEVFESFAAGGLALLAERLEGQVDVLGALLLETKSVMESRANNDGETEVGD